MKNLIAFLFATFSLSLAAQTGGRQKLEAATAAYTAGKLDSAMALVEQAIQLGPGLAKAYKLRGDIHQHRKEFDAAQADYKTSEKLDDTDPRLFVSRAALQITQGRYGSGIREAEKALQLDPKDADAWYDLSCAQYLSGDGDGALKSANKAMDLRPDHAEALYLVGVVEGEQNDAKGGLKDIAKALGMQPDIPGGLMSLAVLLYEDKQYEKAIGKFSLVIAKDTSELAAAHYYRADCWYNLKNKDKACNDWAISAHMGDKDAEYIKKYYCDTDAEKIPKKPKRGRRRTTIQF